MEDKNAVDVELYESSLATSGNARLPVNFVAAGTVENDDVRVYIRQSAYLEIEKLAQSDMKRELGSILIGYVSEQMGKLHVVITDCIEAKYTDASASTLTFTHESWDYIHAEHQRLHADKKIIGWQHTHPGYGVFLSSYDMFIQENFFNLPFQVAYVVDPVQRLRGFFQWKNGKVQKLDGFYIYDEVGKRIADPSPQKLEEKGSGDIRRYKWITLASFCLTLVVTAGLTAAMIVNNQKSQKAIAELAEKNNKLQLVIDQQVRDIAALKVLSDEGATAANAVIWEKYTIVKGDTLSSICKTKGLDYKAYKKIIMSTNGIKNANLIRAGQIILLPMSSSAQ